MTSNGLYRYLLTVYTYKDERQMLLHDVNGNEVTSAEALKYVSDTLRATSNIIESPHIANPTWSSYIAELMVSMIACDANWIFDLSLMDYENERNIVYFIEHPNFPGLIKVGQTNHFQRRMKEIAAENHGIKVSHVNAIAEIEDNFLFEQLLHMWLCEHQKTGEWFSIQNVLAFLNYVKNTRTQK